MSKLKKAPVSGAFLFCLLLVSNVQANCTTNHYDETASIDWVYDGDTVRLKDGRKIRLIAVNTPELGRKNKQAQPLAREARHALITLLQSNPKVKLKYDRQRNDRYGRTLAHVFTADGLNVAAELITSGFGYAVTIPPNDWQSECYFALERKAVKETRGIWSVREYRARDADKVTDQLSGFQLIEGRVRKVKKIKKSLWLELSDSFSVKVSRQRLAKFKNKPLDGLKGKRIRVRGWVFSSKGKLRMSLGHPTMIEILD